MTVISFLYLILPLCAIMVNIIERKDEHRVKEIDGKIGANGEPEVKNKFRWDWLDNVFTVDLDKEKVQVCVGDFIRKIDVAGKALCIFCNDMINYGSRGYKTIIQHVESQKHIRNLKIRRTSCVLPGASDGPNDVNQGTCGYRMHPLFQAQAQSQREKTTQALVSMTDRVVNSEVILHV